MCGGVPEKQPWEEAEIDKMIIGPFHTEETASSEVSTFTSG